ncbi:MAG: hypothetical protein ABIL09_07035 [Gemmatimonadota bacterium]
MADNSIWKRLTSWISLAPKETEREQDLRLRAVVRAATSAANKRKGLVGGRPTKEAGAYDYEISLWNMVGRRTALQSAPLAMLRYMRDYNPDAALAVWNTIRLASKIGQVQVLQFDPNAPEDDWETDDDGLRMVLALDNREEVGREYGGGFRALAGVLLLTLMTQGAAAIEVALTDDLRDVLDFCPVDPHLITFQRDEERIAHPVLNAIAGKPVLLNELQFRYIPLDPDIDDPHGRSPMWPTLESITFQTEVLRDLKAVAHNQGYPRIDVAIVEEIVLKNTPSHLQLPGREDELKAWLDGYLSDLADTYESLNPDDAFLHWDWVQVNMTGPGKGGSGSIDIKALIQIVEAQVISSLKSLPILLGRNEGSTTTHATVQWQIYAEGIESLQGIVRKALEWACNLALQVWGRQSVCRIEFEAPRKTDRYAEAQADLLEAQTWELLVDRGWADDDEAAQAMLGHDATGEAAPKPAVPPPPADEEPERMVRQAGEEAEWANTPHWMQAAKRRTVQNAQVTYRNLRLKAQESFAAISDEDWEAAVAADAEADRGNGRHR